MGKSAWMLAPAVAAALAMPAAMAQAAEATLSLARLDCGAGVGEPRDVSRFSDTFAFESTPHSLTVSCYLIRHGDQVMIWDTGNPAAPPGTEPTARTGYRLVDALAQVDLAAEDVDYVGISHYHGDHTGQAASFPEATLLIGQGDWDVLTGPPSPGVNAEPLAPWISGGGEVQAVSGDADVFGDGSVIMLDTPGHTPGHHSLLVRLADKGPVLLTGDLAHLVENFETDGVPSFNTNRADTLASLHRFKAIAANLGATVIIQHDPRHLDRLPEFPEAAR